MRDIKYGAVAVALAAVLASCSEDTPSEADPVAGEPATGASATDPAGECRTVSASEEPALAPGCWTIQLGGQSGSPRAELDLPTGFSGGDWGVWNNPTNPREWGTISLRTGGDVYTDPCTGRGNPPTVGPTVEDLAAALSAQKLTDTTEPAPVEVDGHSGLHVEASVPVTLDITGCDNQELLVWQEPGGEPVGIDRDYMSRYWVLDVDGRRVVLVVNTHPEATEETVELFSGIVESAALAVG